MSCSIRYGPSPARPRPLRSLRTLPQQRPKRRSRLKGPKSNLSLVARAHPGETPVSRGRGPVSSPGMSLVADDRLGEALNTKTQL